MSRTCGSARGLLSVRVMRAHISLDLNPGERSALKNLTAEEREAVIDDLLAQAREDLEWVVARAAVEEPAPRPRVVTPPPLPPLGARADTRTVSRPVRRPPPRSWINR
jgi:hypothetical protein